MSARKVEKLAVRNPAPAPGASRTPRLRSLPASCGSISARTAIVRTVVQSSIAFILVWAGLSKLGDPVSTYTALLGYQLPAPKVLMKMIALALPWLELLCGLMLAANFHRRLALLVTSVLFSIFLVVVGQAFARGLDISCGCFNLVLFGIHETSTMARFVESVGFAFVRNLLLLGGALWLLRTDCTVTM